jgi:hypothetical protein
VVWSTYVNRRKRRELGQAKDAEWPARSICLDQKVRGQEAVAPSGYREVAQAVQLIAAGPTRGPLSGLSGLTGSCHGPFLGGGGASNGPLLPDWLDCRTAERFHSINENCVRNLF